MVIFNLVQSCGIRLLTVDKKDQVWTHGKSLGLNIKSHDWLVIFWEGPHITIKPPAYGDFLPCLCPQCLMCALLLFYLPMVPCSMLLLIYHQLLTPGLVWYFKVKINLSTTILNISHRTFLYLDTSKVDLISILEGKNCIFCPHNKASPILRQYS